MLGDNIVKIRKLRGMSLSLCAEKIGISRGYLSDIENNIKKNPSLEILGQIASVLEIEISELLTSEYSLDKIAETIPEYYDSKSNVKELQIDEETNLLINKIKKLSNKERTVVEVLVDQLLKEE